MTQTTPIRSKLEIAFHRKAWLVLFCTLAAGPWFGVIAFPATALALSEIKREEVPAPGEETGEATEPPESESGVPMPDPIVKTPLPAPTATTPGEEEPAEPGLTAPEEAVPGDDGDTEAPAEDTATPDADAPIPPIEYDLAKLPEPVRRMHNLLFEAAKTGEVEALRPLIGLGDDVTQLSLGGIEGDPVQFLKETSGDGEGHEILAILEEVLSAGYVHLDAGKPEELYVWPYFFAVPLDKLTPPQRVELFKIVTAGDYEDMKTYGAYIFYRVGIAPDGRWAFFVAGD